MTQNALELLRIHAGQNILLRHIFYMFVFMDQYLFIFVMFDNLFENDMSMMTQNALELLRTVAGQNILLRHIIEIFSFITHKMVAVC